MARALWQQHLAGCDKDRARLDPVERLAKSAFTPAAQRKAVLGVSGRLAKLSGARNFYNHALYALDPQDGAISTILMRVRDRGAEVKIGRRQPRSAAGDGQCDGAESRCLAPDPAL